MAVEERTPKTVTPTGLICPKDPNRASTDPKQPPTHLSADVVRLDIDQSPMLTPQQVAQGKKRKASVAHLVCNTCQHEWTVTPWPPRT